MKKPASSYALRMERLKARLCPKNFAHRIVPESTIIGRPPPSSTLTLRRSAGVCDRLPCRPSGAPSHSLGLPMFSSRRS